MAENKKESFRFYRSNLASVVWNPKAGAPLAEFKRGEFITSEPWIAQKLIDLGYPRVPLDATTPPDILFQKGEILTGDIKLLGPNASEQAALNKERSQAALKKHQEEQEEVKQEEVKQEEVKQEEQEVEIKSPKDYVAKKKARQVATKFQSEEDDKKKKSVRRRTITKKTTKE
jgi:outer membrane biosynthesis protein TonB